MISTVSDLVIISKLSSLLMITVVVVGVHLDRGAGNEGMEGERVAPPRTHAQTDRPAALLSSSPDTDRPAR
jgi:hypothetical protein